MGPRKNNIEYYEIGRCMGTLMTNKVNLELKFCAHYLLKKKNLGLFGNRI